MIHLDEEQNVIEWSGKKTPIVRRARRRVLAWGGATGAALALAGWVAWSLAERPGDWLVSVARAPAFASNPDMADAVAGAGWLAPSIRGGSFGDAIGVAIAALTVVALVSLRVWQHFETGTRQPADDPAGVYKIVTNQTNADDRRPVAWHGWTPSPVCERVKTLVCG